MKDKAIAEIYKECIAVYGCTDLIQHVFKLVCEQEDKFINELIANNKLKHYVAKVIYNTKRWHRTEWAKQQAALEIPTESFNEINLEEYQEITIPLEKLHWFKSEILKLYAELGSYRAVAEKTQINVSAVHKYVTQAKKEIKQLI